MLSTSASRSGRWLDSLRGLCFPPVCLLCNRFMGLSETSVICPSCGTELKRVADPQPSPGPDLSGVWPLYSFSRMARRLVHRIKMTADPRAGTWLSSELARNAFPQSPSFEAVVPVPSHHKSSLLKPEAPGTRLWAETLSSFFGIPICAGLARSRTVAKQTTLTRSRRLEASKSSLVAHPQKIAGYRTVLLADDVMTTGATALSCARVLRKAGVEHVHLAVIARG